MDLRFAHPFTCLVAGPTKAGKTTFVKNLIKNRSNLISEPLSKIWWCYGEYQESYEELKNDVLFIKGFPDMSVLREHSPLPQLLILDDLMQELQNDSHLTELFTRGCHHLNISVIHIV
jgi:septin family protein